MTETYYVMVGPESEDILWETMDRDPYYTLKLFRRLRERDEILRSCWWQCHEITVTLGQAVKDAHRR